MVPGLAVYFVPVFDTMGLTGIEQLKAEMKCNEDYFAVNTIESSWEYAGVWGNISI
jgi:hypothetical protein